MTILCFEAHRADGKVWAIRHNGKWSYHKEVLLCVPMLTGYRGLKAKQPRAFLFTNLAVKLVPAKGALNHPIAIMAARP